MSSLDLRFNVFFGQSMLEKAKQWLASADDAYVEVMIDGGTTIKALSFLPGQPGAIEVVDQRGCSVLFSPYAVCGLRFDHISGLDDLPIKTLENPADGPRSGTDPVSAAVPTKAARSR